MNLSIFAYFVDIFPSALDTTAHMLVYTAITYILFLNMNNGSGIMLHFWKMEGVIIRFRMYTTLVKLRNKCG